MYLGHLTTRIVQKQNELALRVLERAAVYHEALGTARDQLSAHAKLTQARLFTDYFILRTVQVCLNLHGSLSLY